MLNEFLAPLLSQAPERVATIVSLLEKSFGELLVPVLTLTLPMAAVSFCFGFLIALFVALIRLKEIPILNGISQTYVWLIRGTPLLVQLFVIFFGLPSLNILIDPIPAAIFVFSLNVGAYASEIIRGALLTIPKGQWSAGLSLGLTYTQTLRTIVLPQALRSAFPALMNTLISLVKDTSLAASITVVEMFMVAQQIAARTFEPFWLYLEAAFIYLMICTLLTLAQGLMEKRLAYPIK